MQREVYYQSEWGRVRGDAEGSICTNLSGGGLGEMKRGVYYQSEWGRVRGDAEGSVLPI